jgi:hypothetical protein
MSNYVWPLVNLIPIIEEILTKFQKTFMRLSKVSAIELRDKLPRGSAEKIRLRLKKRGIIYTQQYIYRCLDPKHGDHNEKIIDEAINLGEELTLRIQEKEKRVTNLRTNLE